MPFSLYIYSDVEVHKFFKIYNKTKLRYKFEVN